MTAFTAVSGDIPIQPGTKAYNCFASGTITKGQSVAAIDGPNDKGIFVWAPNVSSQRLFGVAAYSAYHNSGVAIYGPGNLVQAKLSGSQSAGTYVGLYHGGMLSNLTKYASGAIVTKGVTSSGDGEVLIL